MSNASIIDNSNGRSGQLYRKLAGYALPALLAIILTFLIIYPMGTIILASLLDSPPRPGSPLGNFTLENYAAVFSGANLAAIMNSLIFSVSASAIAIGSGGSLAWIVARTDVPLRGLAGLASVAPLFISPLVGAIAYSLIASPRSGFINLLFIDLGIPFRFNVYSGTGIVFVLALFYAPYAFLFMSSALQLMNPELEEAAEAHGATRRVLLSTITFPLIKPALLGAAILILVLTLENFSVPQVLGNPAGIETMPTMLFRMMMQTPPMPTGAAAIGMMLLITMMFLVYLQNQLLKQQSFHTISGKGFRPKILKLGVWRWPAFGFAMMYFVLATLLPLFALIESSLRKSLFVRNFGSLFDISAFTLKHFSETLDYAPFRSALINSMILGIATALVGTALHFTLSYYVNRTKLPWRGAIEYIAMVPAGVPSLIIGMGFLWAWIALPLPIYGTLTILVLAYTARFMPQGYRSISSTIVQVHKDLEDSAVVAGASRARATIDILAPLVRPGLASAMFLLFILALRELSTSIFLFTADTRVLAIVLYEQWETGSWAKVATISLFYTVLLSIITLAGRRWLGLRGI